MLQPTVIRACEIVPLKMLWSEPACVVCVARLCCLCLEYLEMRGSLVILWHFTLQPPFFFSSPACVFLIPHISLPLSLCFCQIQ